MTTSREPSSETTAATLIALYVLAEHELLAGLTSVLRRPWSVERQALILTRARLLVRQVLGYLGTRSTPMLSAMITAAAAEGRRDADLAVTRALTPGGAGGGGRIPPGRGLSIPDEDPFDLSMPHGERAARAIRDDVASSLADVRFRITRLPDDIYKMISPHAAIRQVLANDVTPAQAQAMAWRVFVSQGITGFTDKAGRDWSLSAYVEMAVRTAAARAYNASHLARMQALGVEYFSVPDSGHPCPRCFPWQGRILTAREIPYPTIPVDATIAEATAAGLFHPNCRHQLIAVYPGVTVLPEPQVWTPEMQDAYNLTQKQRRLELEVRRAKRQLEFATTPETRADAAAQVRRRQAQVREFVIATGYARQSRREQVDLADPRIKLPTPIR